MLEEVVATVLEGGAYVKDRLKRNKIALENVTMADKTKYWQYHVSIVGRVHVANISFEKTVFARVTFDNWITFEDYYCEYSESHPDGSTDVFTFELRRHNKTAIEIGILFLALVPFLLCNVTMFFTVEMTDTVRIQPWLFNVNQEDAISVELNKKLANKVVYNCGLCICLFDILKIQDSYIFPGDGATHTKVHFRYVVFRPFTDEVLIGKIKSCSREGVTVTMGFFDDILIPPANLQLPSKFDEKDQVWVWEYETEDGTAELFMDIGEEIRFRVVAENFVDTTPSSAPSSGQAVAETKAEDAKSKIPYSLEASISDSGLGLLSWWK